MDDVLLYRGPGKVHEIKQTDVTITGRLTLSVFLYAQARAIVGRVLRFDFMYWR